MGGLCLCLCLCLAIELTADVRQAERCVSFENLRGDAAMPLIQITCYGRVISSPSLHGYPSYPLQETHFDAVPHYAHAFAFQAQLADLDNLF